MKKLITLGFIVSSPALIFAACEPVDEEMLEEDPMMEEEMENDMMDDPMEGDDEAF